MLVVLVAIAAVVVLFLIAWVVVGLVFKLLWWALIGLVIGALARAVLPGKQTISLLATGGAGIASALLGGVIGQIVGVGSFGQFVIAILVAIVLVAVLSGTERARA